MILHRRYTAASSQTPQRFCCALSLVSTICGSHQDGTGTPHHRLSHSIKHLALHHTPKQILSLLFRDNLFFSLFAALLVPRFAFRSLAIPGAPAVVRQSRRLRSCWVRS
uniref:Putative secreted protein n=1 Tax=Anopheles marajoara TaxID=58244 RepID=A0A2M4C8A2_9DIPT